ncbi:MAG: hypothetical protein J1F39_03350 [Clostridiales bacterium]|nr:hypothetical protein [Clostridiales bacterium]
MLFEKKMIILSGAGKGVVLIERNGLGVKFALRTFGVGGELMAGIITPDRVIIRDLPHSPDPAAVFYVDQIDLDNLHFAVFGAELVLYGAIGKRMWQSNIMDILRRHLVRPAQEPVPLAPLTPISDRPKVLPLPDGSGKVQSRLSLYGDEAIASDNFYTGLDIGAAMPRIDAFLDGTRVLSTAPPVGYSVGMSEDASTEAAVYPQQKTQSGKPDEDGDSEMSETEYNDPRTANIEYERSGESAPELEVASVEHAYANPADGAEEPPRRTPWWMREAEYIRALSTRTVIPEIPKIKKVAAAAVRKIREVTFFERTKPDIDKLFSHAPSDDVIAKLLGGKWVKMSLDGGTVSVGRINDNVLCYAVSGAYEKVPPLGDFSQWLPKHADSPTGSGYWLIFQDLTSGDIIK